MIFTVWTKNWIKMVCYTGCAVECFYVGEGEKNCKILNYPYHYYPPLHQSTVTLKKTSACTYFVRSSTILLYLYRTLHILGTTLK